VRRINENRYRKIIRKGRRRQFDRPAGPETVKLVVRKRGNGGGLGRE